MIFRHLGRRTISAYRVEERLTHAEWAQKNIYFTGTEVSPIPGPFNIDKSPHFKKLLQLMDRPQTYRLFAKWASQSGKSLFLMIVVGYRLDTEPAIVIYMQPIKDDIPKIVDLKLDPNLKSMPKLWQKFEDYKATENIRGKSALKKIAGGALVVSGSSIKERKSLTTPLLVFDEPGEMEEGTIEEASERTKAFSKFFPKIVGASTIVTPSDEICTSHDECEVLIEWHYICPECKINFYPDRDYFNFTKASEYAEKQGVEKQDIKKTDYMREARNSAHIKCPHCSNKIDTIEKDRMILNCEMDWFYKDTNIVFKIEDLTDERTFGVNMNSLGSFFVIFDDIVEKEIAAIDNEVKLDKLCRGWYNKFYESDLSNTSEADILLLSNEYEEFEVPDNTVGLYLGVDSQKGYYWVTILAFEHNLVSHLVWAGRVDDEDTIEKLFDREYFYQDGKKYQQGVRRAYHDWQGYRDVVTEDHINDDTGEIMQELLLDMPQKVKMFAFKMAEKHGEDNEMEKYYPVSGIRTLPSGAYLRPKALKLKIEGFKTERELKSLQINKTATTTAFMSSMARSILKAKASGEDEALFYDDRLFYINKTAIEQLKDRENTTNKDLDRQLTSMWWGVHKSPSGKPNKYYSWGRRGSRDDHYIDCISYIQAAVEQDNLTRIPKPERENKMTETVSTIRNMFNS